MSVQDKRVLARALSRLSETDLKVAAIGFDFYRDLKNGYGIYLDGTEGEINNAYTYLLARLIGQPEQVKETENGLRGYSAPYGYMKQDVRSDRFHSGDNWPRDFTIEQLVDLGVALADIPEDPMYTGLNIDEDCAVAELLSALAQAYSWYSSGYDWEYLKPPFRKRFEELGLDIHSCQRRADELLEESFRTLDGKFDRNTQLWC